MTPDRPSAPSPTSRPLILGSTSRYRHELLSRLKLPFEAVAPNVDETPRSGENPADLAVRLALAKAREVAARHLVASGQLLARPISDPGMDLRDIEVQTLAGRHLPEAVRTLQARFDALHSSLKMNTNQLATDAIEKILAS